MEGGDLGTLTFRVQGLDLQLQWGVLEVELAGGGHDLDPVDEVDDGVTAQHLACGWRDSGRSAQGGDLVPSQKHCLRDSGTQPAPWGCVQALG